MEIVGGEWCGKLEVVGSSGVGAHLPASLCSPYCPSGVGSEPPTTPHHNNMPTTSFQVFRVHHWYPTLHTSYLKNCFVAHEITEQSKTAQKSQSDDDFKNYPSKINI